MPRIFRAIRRTAVARGGRPAAAKGLISRREPGRPRIRRIDRHVDADHAGASRIQSCASPSRRRAAWQQAAASAPDEDHDRAIGFLHRDRDAGDNR